VFAQAFAGCSDGSSGDGGDDLGDSATVTGDGTVKTICVPKSDSEALTYVDMGTLVKGELTLSPPQSISDGYLYKPAIPENITIEPSDAKMFGARLYLYRGETIAGALSFGKSTKNESHSILYWYFPQAASITGELSVPSGFLDGNTSYYYQINAKAGWNQVYLFDNTTSDGGNVTRTMTTDLTGAPADLKWTLGN
jgi:hypothetical protein